MDDMLMPLEEKLAKYAELLKLNMNKRRNLKSQIEKYIANGRDRIDEFCEQQIAENDIRHDKRALMKEYVRLIWENKI